MSEMWRFPDAYADNSGLEDGNIGQFKGTPFASLAREICQNSIDARLDKTKPVEVEFKRFNIPAKKIPGYESLFAEFEKCKKSAEESSKPKVFEYFERCIELLGYNSLPCLRISDTNTKGLWKGINEKGKYIDNFDSLFKGSGSSDKDGNTGGSKGVGKNATFVTSGLRTVFYATKTFNGRQAFAGKCKVISRKADDSTKKTLGLGYFTNVEENEPIENYYSLDENFSREDNCYGTDIFVCALRNSDTWVAEMINDILDSFLVAIYRESLVVKIENIVISKEKIPEILNSNLLTPKIKAKISNEYYLLHDHADIAVKKYQVTGFEDYPIEIRVIKELKDIEPTRAYSIVRFPYMQIMHTKKTTILGYSALVLIEDNPLCEFLIDLEDITHKKWSAEDIDEPSKKQFANNVKNQIFNFAAQAISEVLSTSTTDTSDFEGANELMPEVEDDSNDGDVANTDTHSRAKKEEPLVTKGKKPKRNSTAKTRESADSENYDQSLGEIISGTGGGVFDEPNDIPSKPHEPGDHPGPKDVDITEGKHKVLKPFALSGVRVSLTMVNKEDGLCLISFISNKDGEDAYFTVSYVDAANTSNPIIIKKAVLDGNELSVKGNIVSGFNLSMGKKYAFKVYVDTNEYFGGEVKIYAY